MSSTTSDPTESMDAADYHPPSKAEREVKRTGEPAPVRTNNHWETIHGEYLPDASLLSEGDDIYVTYRERREAGGLRFSNARMAISGRVIEIDDDRIVVDQDFSESPVKLRLNSHSDGRPTIVFNDATYGVKGLIRRTDTSQARWRTVKAIESLASEGIEVAEELGATTSETWKGRAEVTTPDEFQIVIEHLDEIEAERSIRWYESEDDFLGETGFKSKDSVTDYEKVWITFWF